MNAPGRESKLFSNELVDKVNAAIISEMVRVCKLTEACLIDTLAQAVPITPVDTGKLRRSGYVYANIAILARGRKDGSIEKDDTWYQIHKGEMEFRLGFSAGHAKKVHEAVYCNFRRGQAKFLEKPWLANKRKLLSRIYNEISIDKE